MRESTQTRDRAEALQILDRRRIEVFRGLGEDGRADAVLRGVAPLQLDILATDFLREYAAGDLAGRKPARGTVDVCISHLLGARGGLLPFARSMKRTHTSQFDALVVTRWLEAESRRLSNDSVRMKIIVARHLARYAHGRGLLRPDALQAILALRPPASARGRAQVDGVPAMHEVERLLAALRPRRHGDLVVSWDKLAELQLRLGLRRSEVVALDETWLEPMNARIVVRVCETFDTKSHASRNVDGVDGVTFALAREVIAMKRRLSVTASGYKEAWKRACSRLDKAGTPWSYRNKSHSLRSVYATLSRLAGIPLTVVRDRLGHSSERVTERHYLGRTDAVVPGPFAGQALFTQTGGGAAVIPLPLTRSA